MANPIDDDTLQRFYDGDLTPLEEHGVQARIEADPAAQRRLAELGRLTDLIRDAADELGAQVDSRALFAGIAGQIAQPEKVAFGARLRLVAAEWVEHKRAVLVPMVAASAVAAATLLVVLRPQGPVADVSIGEVAQLREYGALDAPPGSSIEAVDFGSNTGTVFEVDNHGVSAAVVWIAEDEEAHP